MRSILKRDKKAQEGFTLPVMLALILGIIALVVVVIGVTKGWNYVFDKLGLLPDDLTSASQACATYAATDELKIGYCQYRELTIEGVKQWANCPYIYDAAVKVLGAGKVGFGKETCEVTPAEYCAQLRVSSSNFKESTKVHGKACSELGCKMKSGVSCKDPTGGVCESNLCELKTINEVQKCVFKSDVCSASQKEECTSVDKTDICEWKDVEA